MARISWKADRVVSLRLKPDCYCLAQMLRSPFLRVFNVTNDSDDWSDIDLDTREELFTVSVGNVVFKDLASSVVPAASVTPSRAETQSLWMKPHLSFDGGYPFRGAKLIDIGETFDTTKGKVLKENLDVRADRDQILSLELTSMWGAEDLRERLLKFLDEGERIPPMKCKVFPGLCDD